MYTAGRVGPGIGFIMFEQLQCDGPPGLRLHTLAPELQLWVDGTVEPEVLIETF